MHIPHKNRALIDASCVGNCAATTEPQLQYAIMRLITGFQIGRPDQFQAAVGCLEAVKHEIYRKHLNPQAAQAEFENGAVE